jgi:hypothetical protein
MKKRPIIISGILIIIVISSVILNRELTINNELDSHTHGEGHYFLKNFMPQHFFGKIRIHQLLNGN